jgi:diaminopimelate decarboxylase
VTIAGPEADQAGEPDVTGVPAAALPTPALLLDPDVASRNISQMAEAFRPLPARLRPHVKAHKCAELARLQLEAGAGGLTCATVAEVAAFSRHGAPPTCCWPTRSPMRPTCACWRRRRLPRR